MAHANILFDFTQQFANKYYQFPSINFGRMRYKNAIFYINEKCLINCIGWLDNRKQQQQ